MKTILVIFVDEKVNPELISKYREYSFNTDADVKVGDVLSSPEYNSLLQVVKVLDEYFKYFTYGTGELTNERNLKENQGLIKSLVL